MAAPRIFEPILTLTLASPEATSDLARRLAPHLGAGDTLLLEGGIGAGKTHFARALIQTRLEMAGRIEDVPSPTFTLVQTYHPADIEIWHADLYRLTSSQEVFELGLQDAFGEALCLVEWPDRLGIFQPEKALFLRFSTIPGKDLARDLVFASADPLWKSRLEPLLAETRG